MNPIDQFRSNPIFVGTMAQLIKGDGSGPTVLAQLIVALQNNLPANDTSPNADPIESVRLLSRIAERQQVISEILSTAEPLQKEDEVTHEPTWDGQPELLAK